MAAETKTIEKNKSERIGDWHVLTNSDREEFLRIKLHVFWTDDNGKFQKAVLAGKIQTTVWLLVFEIDSTKLSLKEEELERFYEEMYENDGTRMVLKLPMTMIAQFDSDETFLIVKTKHLRVLKFEFQTSVLRGEFLEKIKDIDPIPLAFHEKDIVDAKRAQLEMLTISVSSDDESDDEIFLIDEEEEEFKAQKEEEFLQQSMLLGKDQLLVKKKHVYDDGWLIYDAEREFFSADRLGLDKHTWRVTTVNQKYKVSRTYPRSWVVPIDLTDREIEQAASFRTKNRLPALCWQHHKTKAVLFRSSQPAIGIGFYWLLGKIDGAQRADSIMVEKFAKKGTRELFIADCRPQTNALANHGRGGGIENPANYTNCTIDFLGISNIHAMRRALQELSQACYEQSGQKLWQSDACRNWLAYTQTVLDGARLVASKLEEGISVLVHCSDGWDRTSQVCALAQLMLEPRYRTMEGFAILIEKEWLQFGHQFDKRCDRKRIATFFSNEPSSPIFLQFMDCVWQFFQQNPLQFGFNEKYLLAIMDHVYSCKFGTFLFDCDEYRSQFELQSTTPSLWHFLHKQRKCYEIDCATITPKMLESGPAALWQTYYARFRESKQPTGLLEIMNEGQREFNRKLSELEQEISDLKKEQPKEKVSKVTCTILRPGSGKKAVLVAHLSSSNPEQLENFCRGMRRLRIVENYKGKQSLTTERSYTVNLSLPDERKNVVMCQQTSLTEDPASGPKRPASAPPQAGSPPRGSRGPMAIRSAPMQTPQRKPQREWQGSVSPIDSGWLNVDNSSHLPYQIQQQPEDETASASEEEDYDSDEGNQLCLENEPGAMVTVRVEAEGRDSWAHKILFGDLMDVFSSYFGQVELSS